MPAGKLGKVLMAKVGTRGGQLPGSHNPATEIESAEFNADATKRREQLGRYNDNPIYANHLHVEIGFEPTLVSASEASLVLRDYGFGLKPQRYHNKSGRKVAEDGTVTFSDANRIDFWLVEEVPPSMIDRMGRVRDLKAEAEAAALEAATAPASAPEKHQQRRG